MPNTITPYDPIFYAANALSILKKKLGMAARVYRGYDKAPQQLGSVIQIRRPSTFIAQNAPSSAQELAPSTVSITLDQWKEVKFELTDKELNYTGERIIAEHIDPAAHALADAIDDALVTLYRKVPWATDVTVASASVADITAARKVLFNNKVPMDDLHLMVDGNLEAAFLGLQAFSQFQGAGQVGVETQMRGTLGTKFGFEVFANQNVRVHTSATVADLAGTVVGAHSAGATSLAVTALSANAALKAGDIVKIAGQTQQYAIQADVTLGASGDGTLTIHPSLASSLSGGEVVTVELSGGSGGTKTQNLAFHRNAFALAMAPLTTLPSRLGAMVETVYDDVTNLALRSRMFYDGNNSKVYVALDVLYGVAVLDANLAVRLRAA